MSRVFPLCLLGCLILCPVLHVFAATYTYRTIDAPASWKVIHTIIHGMDDTGRLVGSTTEQDGTVRPWRYTPQYGWNRWNIKKSALEYLWANPAMTSVPPVHH